MKVAWKVLVLGAMLFLTGCNINTEVTEPPEEPAAPSTIIREAMADYVEGEFQPYSEDAFRKALADDKKVFLDFHADWCPICRGNHPIISAGFGSSYMDDVVGFQVNYDKEIALRQELGITTQSTLVLFDAGTEINRAVGPQTAETLEAFITKS